MNKLRVGYIIDDSHQSHLIYDLVERKETKHYSVEFLIVQKTFRTEEKGIVKKVWEYVKSKGLAKLAERLLFGAISKLEKVIVTRQSIYKTHFNSYSLESFSKPKIYVNPNLSKSGLVYKYSEEDLNKIKDLSLDVLVRGCSGILRGEILNICKHGIISFHHANNDVNRGGPPAFWEVYNREPSTGFIIQRLFDELDGGDVLFKGAIPTSPLYMLNLLRLFRKANIFMHKALEDLGRTRQLPDVYIKHPYAYPLYKTPTLLHQFLYLLKTLIYMVGKVVRKIKGKYYRWGVAYQFVDDWQSAVLWKSKIINNPPNRFLADPFVFKKDGLNVCFVEDYDYATSRGKISAFKIDSTGYEELGVALQEPFHLSYPYIFENDGKLFMCPETNEANDLRIYKCLEFPLKWTLHKVLMNNVSAHDTNIFKYSEKWWMFTNIDSSDISDTCSELYLFYADTFDSDQWCSHPKNPIVFDCLKARNGGFIFDKGNLFRVFQVQGFDMYGESIGISLIKELTTETYSEVNISKIRPKFFPNLKGTHHLSFYKGLLALDYVKIESAKN